MKIFLFAVLIFYNINPTKAQSFTDSTANVFINSLTLQRDRLDKIILPDELELSKRLGITYKNIDKKYLISNDIEPEIRDKITKNQLTFTFSIDKLADDYSRLKFVIPKINLTRDYFFKKTQLISKPYYYSRDWKIIKSEYFIFHISYESFFNKYSADKLDSFVKKISHLLKYSGEQIENLRKNKIHYFLCTDESEIKQLTGYSARGLYYIPYDYIITTYNCHYHELLHLLINFKLKSLYLYTSPLLQEGFAVAFGGRGGKEPRVILDMGLFLVKSGMLDYNSLLTKPDFYQSDISMSYPVSGIYNKFLIQTDGIEKYLGLYQKYSTTENNINDLNFDKSDLPPDDKWKRFIDSYFDSTIIIAPENKSEFKLIAKGYNYKISGNNYFYLFQIKDTVLLSPRNSLAGYKSKLFSEIFPSREYHSEKYAIIADSNEISVYNFYSNNLEAKYVRGFDIHQQPVKFTNGYYRFLISLKLFDEPMNKLFVK
jgi:hypothetical protein